MTVPEVDTATLQRINSDVDYIIEAARKLFAGVARDVARERFYAHLNEQAERWKEKLAHEQRETAHYRERERQLNAECIRLGERLKAPRTGQKE